MFIVDDDYFTCPICGVEHRPNDRNYCIECTTLVDAAVEALSVARRVGVPKYGPSSWRDISQAEHCEHAAEHIMNLAITHISGVSSAEDHLSHAICRLAMAKAIQDAS